MTSLARPGLVPHVRAEDRVRGDVNVRVCLFEKRCHTSQYAPLVAGERAARTEMWSQASMLRGERKGGTVADTQEQPRWKLSDLMGRLSAALPDEACG